MTSCRRYDSMLRPRVVPVRRGHPAASRSALFRRRQQAASAQSHSQELTTRNDELRERVLSLAMPSSRTITHARYHRPRGSKAPRNFPARERSHGILQSWPGQPDLDDLIRDLDVSHSNGGLARHESSPWTIRRHSLRGASTRATDDRLVRAGRCSARRQSDRQGTPRAGRAPHRIVTCRQALVFDHDVRRQHWHATGDRPGMEVVDIDHTRNLGRCARGREQDSRCDGVASRRTSTTSRNRCHTRGAIIAAMTSEATTSARSKSVTGNHHPSDDDRQRAEQIAEHL